MRDMLYQNKSLTAARSCQYQARARTVLYGRFLCGVSPGGPLRRIYLTVLLLRQTVPVLPNPPRSVLPRWSTSSKEMAG